MKYINLHTHNNVISASEIAIENLFPEDAEKCLNKCNGVFYSIGLHPWYINKDSIDEKLEIIEKHITHPQVIAVGEIGLDRRCNVDFQLQHKVLMKQLSIAERYRKPVVMHVVKAYSDIIAIKKKLNPKIPWILHGYQANSTITLKLIEQGFYFSFGVRLLNQISNNVDIVRIVPHDRLFLENDDSEIEIEQIYEKATAVLSLSLENLKQIINQNFNKLFGNGFK